jgi:hypothetical protein
VRELAERAYFFLCLTVGRLLRFASYSRTRVVRHAGELEVRKRRSFHAPLFVRMGDPLLGILDAGVRVLSQREWEVRERLLYRTLRGTAIRVDPDGTLVLPCLAGETLSALLENPELDRAARTRAIELAVLSLRALHHVGFTHGDAMAENVMVDLVAGVAHWFDFETVHDSRRPIAWRRADDLRALLATCLLRCDAEEIAGTAQLVLDVYADDRVTNRLAASFTAVLRRPLAFHLGQAALSFRCFREVGRLLRERLA